MKKEEFIKYAEKIVDYIEKERVLDEALRALSPDFGGFCIGELLSDMVDLLGICVNDKEKELDYWFWEYDCGKSALADSVTINDEPVPFKTLDDVYDMIIRDRVADEKDDTISSYLIDQVNKYKKLYENEKDHSETLQRIVDKTMDAIVDEAVPKAAKEITKRTTTDGNALTLDELLDMMVDELLEEFGSNE